MMKSQQIVDALGLISEDCILDAERAAVCKGATQQQKKRWPVFAAAAAACIALLIGGLGLSGALWGPGDYPITPVAGSAGTVRVSRLRRSPGNGNIATEAELVYFTEEEIIHWQDAVVFRGTVSDIENLNVDMNGMDFYWSVVTVQVSKVLRGDLAPGDSVRIQFYATISSDGQQGIWTEDGDVVQAIRVGMEGIFQPVLYNDENCMFGANDAWLDLRDIAQCGFPDGLRWAFLQTDSGLLFDRSSHEGAAGAQTLDEIEAYFQERLSSSPQETAPVPLTGTLLLYSEPTAESTEPSVAHEAGLSEKQTQKIRALLEEVDAWEDDRLANRNPFFFDGEFQLPDWPDPVYFSYQSQVLYTGHTFCQISPEKMEQIRILCAAAITEATID